MRRHRKEHLPSAGRNKERPSPAEAEVRAVLAPARVFFGAVAGLYPNPRLMLVEESNGALHEVVLGNAHVFWIGAPVAIRPSVDYGERYYELAEDPPRFRGDKFYVERVERVRAASGVAAFEPGAA
jgi:hypothetical protein